VATLGAEHHQRATLSHYDLTISLHAQKKERQRWEQSITNVPLYPTMIDYLIAHTGEGAAMLGAEHHQRAI
jgi:hypothetical protein